MNKKMIKPVQHILVSITAKSCRYNVSGFVEELTRLPENRWDHACAALPTGVRPVQPSTFAGFCCCRRNRWIQLFFFCVYIPPWEWGNILDSTGITSKTIVVCSSFNCGRKAQGDWGSGC